MSCKVYDFNQFVGKRNTGVCYGAMVGSGNLSDIVTKLGNTVITSASLSKFVNREKTK